MRQQLALDCQSDLGFLFLVFSVVVAEHADAKMAKLNTIANTINVNFLINSSSTNKVFLIRYILCLPELVFCPPFYILIDVQ